MNQELNEYLRLFFSVNDPIFFSIFITVILFVLIYIIFRYVIFPLQRNYQLEKKELELKNAQLMSLFAELDPDPVLRINSEGIIIFTNEAAQKLSQQNLLDGKNVKEILPQIKFNIKNYIEENKSGSFFHTINTNYYSILFRGISALNIAQIYFHDFTDKKKYERKLLHYNKRLKELSNNLLNNLEEERQRIARELHDSIGQNLLLMKMKLQNYDNTLHMAKNGEKNYNEIIESLEKTIVELKFIIFDLKPKILEEMGLGPALKSLCQKISAESEIKGSINISGVNNRLNKKIEISLFRIIQEALNNIVKHSNASEFNIQLIHSEQKIRLMISDDGKGINKKNIKNNRGLGLVNMRERIENLKGNFKIDSSPNRGTLLIFEIPKEKQI
ncbi:MAG: sensor histidine kinase [Bacteroidetes bacterium]|nr:sensor histidine kinase [Bacteroidota bacterium]